MEDNNFKIDLSNKDIKIKEIMTKEPLTLQPSLVGGEAVEIMYKQKKLYAPVVEDNKLEGWIYALDILVGCKHSKVEDLMLFTDEITILNENDNLKEDLIIDLVRKEYVAYPVVNDNNEVVGTLSVFDILRYFVF